MFFFVNKGNPWSNLSFKEYCVTLVDTFCLLFVNADPYMGVGFTELSQDKTNM